MLCFIGKISRSGCWIDLEENEEAGHVRDKETDIRLGVRIFWRKVKKPYAFTLHQKSRKERRTAAEPLGALDTCPLKFVGTIAGKVNLQVECWDPPRTAECGLHLQSFLGLKNYGVLWEVTRLGSFESNLPKKTAYSISSCPAERTWKRCKTWNLEGAKIRGGVLHLPENAALGVPH